MAKDKPVTFEVSDKKYPNIELPSWLIDKE